MKLYRSRPWLRKEIVIIIDDYWRETTGGLGHERQFLCNWGADFRKSWILRTEQTSNPWNCRCRATTDTHPWVGDRERDSRLEQGNSWCCWVWTPGLTRFHFAVSFIPPLTRLQIFLLQMFNFRALNSGPDRHMLSADTWYMKHIVCG